MGDGIFLFLKKPSVRVPLLYCMYVQYSLQNYPPRYTTKLSISSILFFTAVQLLTLDTVFAYNNSFHLYDGCGAHYFLILYGGK